MPLTTDIAVAKYANKLCWTDIEAHEIVSVRTPRKILIRRLDTKVIEDPAVFTPGGFCGHFANDRAVKYAFTPNETRPVITIRLHKDGQWRDANGGRYSLNTEPVEFYDRNF